MSRRCHRQYHHEEHRDDRRPCGVIRRVTQGLADRFGVPRKLVLAGFIVGLIMNAPLTIFLFLLALYWVSHPGSLERKLNRLAAWLRSLGDKGAARHATAGAGSAAPEPEFDPDAEFAELRRKFEDLERRAGSMETHVASEEYDLNREFGRMQDNDDRK
ncbi:MAG: PspC domain-containing protein [Ectothiorhodospiraceae bacterium]|jgi:phage shock protein PspC (stress-responsive transcriptional regulator)